MKPQLLCMVMCVTPGLALALDAVVLEAHSAQLPGGVASGVKATLRVVDPAQPTLELQAATLELTGEPPSAHASSALALVLRDLQLHCGQLLIAEPRFACRRAALSLRQDALGAQRLSGAVQFRSAPAQLDATLLGLRLADGRVDIAAHWRAPPRQPPDWQLKVDGSALALERVQSLLAPWVSLPQGITLKGRSTVSVTAAGSGAQPRAATLSLALDGLEAQNAASTVATDKLGARLTATATRGAEGFAFQLELHGDHGQVLAGPVLLDLDASALTATATGVWRGNRIDVRQLALTQSQLLSLSGHGQLRRGVSWQLAEADVTLAQLQFPAAYVSFLQLPLATTDFAALRTAGTASGRLLWHDGAPQRLTLNLDGLTFDDPERHLRLAGLRGVLQWSASAAHAPSSHLAWQELRAYGLEGGAAQLDFQLTGRRFALAAPARLPLFDGGLAVRRFEARALGAGAMQLDFDADIEPISMRALSRAFGWPEMAGTLAGRLPGLAYRNGELRVQGEIAAQVFDGTVSVQRLRLQDPLGNWPQLSADVRARNIDLERITRTFPIGSITGRLDADVLGLELFDWSPVAFDARLYTTPGDRSRHRISQKAVSSLSDLGGGGGGVTAALQSGFLKFFQTFGYERIGLSCQLRDDVCLMDGIHRPNGGFYIVKGGGLPRIDIIGNAGRVAWGQLLGQIQSAINSGELQVK